MADPVPDRTRTAWLWILVIAVLAIVLVVWLFKPAPDAEDVAATATFAPSDGFTVAPADTGVPVDLPEATLAAPIGSPAPSASPSPEGTASPGAAQ